MQLQLLSDASAKRSLQEDLAAAAPNQQEVAAATGSEQKEQDVVIASQLHRCFCARTLQCVTLPQPFASLLVAGLQWVCNAAT